MDFGTVMLVSVSVTYSILVTAMLFGAKACHTELEKDIDDLRGVNKELVKQIHSYKCQIDIEKSKRANEQYTIVEKLKSENDSLKIAIADSRKVNALIIDERSKELDAFMKARTEFKQKSDWWKVAKDQMVGFASDLIKTCGYTVQVKKEYTSDEVI